MYTYCIIHVCRCIICEDVCMCECVHVSVQVYHVRMCACVYMCAGVLV